jgi:tripartite ATP-independent transporter DctP family solute receptor
MKYRNLIATALTAAGLLAAVSSSSAVAEPQYVLKFGHLANEDNVWNKAALKFAEEVKALSNGAIEVQVYPNEQLGKEMDLINGIQLGTVDMTITGESLQNWAPSAALLAIPYGVQDLQQLDLIAGGDIGKQIEKDIVAKTGLRPVAYFARGPRDLTSNRPIKTPDDLNGLRLRVPNVPLFVSVWSALGAKPIPMAFSEVFTSLQSGTIDAQENPLSLIKSASFFEVQKYVNLTEHVWSWIYVVIGDRKFQKMPEDLQRAVLEAAKRMQEFERTEFLSQEELLASELAAKGMEFVASDKKAFAEKAKPAVLKALKPEVHELYEQMLKAIN